ncbi:hypothetical protein DL765_010725 [Monosporascus sp. GIB2]|nr:hypothetical protein DL765_010725 [Monosporascus sp. GIB2]
MMLSYRWPYRPVSSIISIAAYSIVVTLIFSAFLFLYPSVNSTSVSQVDRHFDHYLDLLADESSPNSSNKGWHPIDSLILNASRQHELLLRKRSTNIHFAAAEYRIRRGRNPPPGFDKWFDYAQRHDAIIIEQFFDRIEHDIRPFWGLDPAEVVARTAAVSEDFVRVRGGVARGLGDIENRPPWLQLWTDLVNEAAKWLPDLDMPINYMDEPRLLVPWEEVNNLVKEATERARVVPPDEAIQQFSGPPKAGNVPEVAKPDWQGPGSAGFWDLARDACPPNAPGRNVTALKDYSFPPDVPPDWRPSFSEAGFVSNFTASLDPCWQPHLRGMHGTFVEPISISTSKNLFPLFSGCKLPMNNDILIPGAMYLANDAMYSGGNSHGPPWEQKKGGVIWRGVGSGGRNKEENWTRFQRHRLVEMLNGTTIKKVVHGDQSRPMTFEMDPTLQGYNLSLAIGGLGDWLLKTADVGFVDLLCFPADANCTYVTPYFHPVDKVPMEQQFQQKFIPDVDGNSFSARFRALLLSTSLPLKATIYTEWHDDRLQPWLHFVPLDNTFQDLYAVLDFFTRDAKGDAAARMIAEAGKSWGERVLRRHDMMLYVWRLLLEFARVSDVNRDQLGYVDDLLYMKGIKPG